MSEEVIRHDRQLREWLYAATSSIHGKGVFARQAIAAGEYIGTFWGPEAKRNGTYVLWVYEDENAPPLGRSGRNMLRYLNHSQSGNSEFDGFDLFALTDIAVDDEITFDYRESEDLD